MLGASCIFSIMAVFSNYWWYGRHRFDENPKTDQDWIIAESAFILLRDLLFTLAMWLFAFRYLEVSYMMPQVEKH